MKFCIDPHGSQGATEAPGPQRESRGPPKSRISEICRWKKNLNFARKINKKHVFFYPPCPLGRRWVAPVCATTIWAKAGACSTLSAVVITYHARQFMTLIPFNLYLTPYTFYLIPSNLYLTPYTLYLISCNLYLLPFTFYLVPYTSYLIPCTLYLLRCTLRFLPSTVYIMCVWMFAAAVWSASIFTTFLQHKPPVGYNFPYILVFIYIYR